MTPLCSYLIRRMIQLANTFTELKSRVRLALATETAHVVSSAVQDVLVATLHGNPPRENSLPRSRWHTSDDWEPDGDPWNDSPYPEYHEPPIPTESSPVGPVSVTANLAQAANLVVQTWRSRWVPGWAVATLGIVASVAATTGGPIWAVTQTLAMATLDLLPHLLPSTT